MTENFCQLFNNAKKSFQTDFIHFIIKNFFSISKIKNLENRRKFFF